jgi:hypothetical protein
MSAYPVWLGVILFVFAQALTHRTVFAEQGPEPKAEPAVTVESMIEKIVSKNVFRPGEVPKITTQPSQVSDVGPKPLYRPFTVIGTDQTDQGFQAILAFGTTGQLIVKKGEVIENTVEILKIYPTYILCKYGKWEVPIYMKETSEDARQRLQGFDGDYKLKGITILPQESYAHFLIDGRLRRVNVGNRLGKGQAKDEVIKIEPEKVTMRSGDGNVFLLEPEPTIITAHP